MCGALTSYTWDGEDRLTVLAQPGTAADTYTYAADGLRRSLTAATPLLQISAGGGAAAPYAADADYSGGGTYSTTNAVSTAGVINPAPQSVYQHERNGNTSAHAFTYTLPGLTAGAAYTLRLHFSENYCTGAGQRLFSVSVNGIQVLAGFDIYATAGGQYKAVVESFPAMANGGGQIVVSFTNGSANYAKVDGLEVWPGATRFVWDGQNVLLETDGSGNTQAHYTDSPGAWGGLVSMRQGPASHFFAFDPSQNTRALTDINGNVTDTYVYTAFGDEKA